MLAWLSKFLETFRGKTTASVIVVFILGTLTMNTLPKWFVTTEAFQKSLKSIYHEMNRGDKWRELEIITLKKTFLERQKKELADEYAILEQMGDTLTMKQINRLKDIEDEIREVEQYVERLIKELQKPET